MPSNRKRKSSRELVQLSSKWGEQKKKKKLYAFLGHKLEQSTGGLVFATANTSCVSKNKDVVKHMTEDLTDCSPEKVIQGFSSMSWRL